MLGLWERTQPLSAKVFCPAPLGGPWETAASPGSPLSRCDNDPTPALSWVDPTPDPQETCILMPTTQAMQATASKPSSLGGPAKAYYL